MNHQQEEVVIGYEVSQVTYVTSAGPPPPPPPPQPPLPPQPPPPPPRMSLFRILVIAFIGGCIFIGALTLLIWLIYRPRTIQVAVATATLARFDLNTTPTTPVLSYDLSAVLSVSNPNRRVSIYYDQLQAAGLYQEERFGRAALPLSFQGTRHADAVPVLLAGDTSMEFGDSGVAAFDGDRSARVFPVDLWVNGVVRYKFGELMTTTASTLTVKCHLALELTVASGWVECTVIDF